MRSVMKNVADPSQAARLIRRRLFWLLGKVFGVVVLITMVLLLGLIAIGLRGPRPSGAVFPPSQLPYLEAYYLARGSWEGVDALWERSPGEGSGSIKWAQVLLLDEDDRVIAGRTDDVQPGQIYPFAEDRISFTVQDDGQTVGRLVLTTRFVLPPFVLALGVAPSMVILLVTGLVTLVIGLLLMRRIVAPLAEVIAAAQLVTTGDLSTRVQARGPDDLRGLSESFNRMVDTLERNDRERRNLLADVAHELRTPLTILRGRLEGILDGVYSADEAQIAPALAETYLLESLVEDLRLLTLAEAGQLSLECQVIDLGEIAERTVSLFEAEAADKGIALSLRIEPNLPYVTADPQRVGQVIGNLLGNALRYVPAHILEGSEPSPEGSGGQVTIMVRQTEEGLALTVSDNGPGVPEADLPHLFDRFWRGEKSRARSSGGAGLGLAIAKQLIEAQNGRIYAENEAGGGLRVTFIL